MSIGRGIPMEVIQISYYCMFPESPREQIVLYEELS